MKLIQRMFAADPARQRHRGRRAKQADINAGRAKSRIRSGDREIAGGDELTARRRRHAVDGGDHRLRGADDVLHQHRAGGHGLRKKGMAAVLIIPVRCQFPKVMAGAEDGPFGL